MNKNIRVRQEQEFEEDIKDIFQKPVKIPEEIKQAQKQAQNSIRAEEIEKRRKKKRFAIKTAAAAAIVVAFTSLCAASPVLARHIPIVESVFAKVGKVFGFYGDFSEYAMPLQEEKSYAESYIEDNETFSGIPKDTNSEIANNSSGIAKKSYSITDNGAEISLSEVYCHEKAMYISLMIRSEEPMPQTDILGEMCHLTLYGPMLDFSYVESEDGEPLLQEIEGKMLDDYTYAGVLRLDLPQDVPDNFTLSFMIQKVTGYYKETEWSFDGQWKFEIEATVDHRNVITKTVNQDGKSPIGEITVTKCPFEINLEYDAEKVMEADYFITALDADGNPMISGLGCTDNLPVSYHNVSEITIYAFDYCEYMDEIKGYRSTKEKSYRELYDERAVFSETVKFE